jgi:hypothetical protein
MSRSVNVELAGLAVVIEKVYGLEFPSPLNVFVRYGAPV